MSTLILGAGAIGGYFGGRLAEAGADVTFLVRPRRQQQLVRDGLVVTSPLGDIRLPVKTVLAGAVGAGFDFVLLTCKAYDLDDAMDAIAPAMAGGATVIPMLNGMAHMAQLDARFTPKQVMGGTCRIDIGMLPDGTIKHSSKLQQIVFGDRRGKNSPRAERFAGLFAPTPVEWSLVEDIEQRMWDKLAFLSALAVVCVLFRGNVKEINAAPGGREAAERTFAANMEIARLSGYPLNDAARSWSLDRLTDPTGLWSASLFRDLEAGGKVEGEQIIGWMLQRAREFQVDDTMLSLAWTAIRAYETRRGTR